METVEMYETVKEMIEDSRCLMPHFRGELIVFLLFINQFTIHFVLTK